ncbi:MAG TPA: hypothetical protein VI855_05180 [Dehalococcoidia bacterium]|nr:hypothetical protein [Dehalococcoidia bacterium]
MTTTAPCKKTKKMLQAEALAGKPLEQALPELLNVHGYRGTARYLNSSPGALAWWLLKFGIRTKFVAIPRGYRLLLVPEGMGIQGIDLAEAAE